MIHVKLVSPVPHGACSFYRCFGPFQRLKDTFTFELGDARWEWLTDTDIIFFERPNMPNYVELMQVAKDMKIKTWIDFDDNLMELPKWNPGHKHFKMEVTQKSIKRALELADMVTVATPALKEFYGKFRKGKIEVIPNAFNNYNFTLEYNPGKDPVIFWRGSNTHRGDLTPFAGEMWVLAEKYPEWQWVFIGDENDLWYFTDNIKNKKIIPTTDCIRYMNYIKNINAAIYLSPLATCDFNKAKSNCGWIEGTYSGAATIGPDFPEFKRPGITNYKDPKDFAEKLEQLMQNDVLRRQNYKKSFEFIKSNLQLSNVNRKREAIIKDLTK